MAIKTLNNFNFRDLRYKVLWVVYALFVSPPFAAAQATSSLPEIQLNITDHQFNNLQKSKGTKLKLNNAILLVNGDTAKVKDIHLRGNNTLYFKRKSLSIDLGKTLTVTVGSQDIPLKKFHLLNLAMDKNLWHNRWSYTILNELGLFPSFNSFCTLTINDNSQGIYLLVEKPQHAAEVLKSPYVIRRGVQHAIDHDYIDTKSKEEVKQYKELYYSLYKTKSIQGQALYDHLSNALDLNHYFKWLAFNYLIMNGDYADELFLYINPKSKKYDLIAWDYDDLFMVSPHEGREVRNQQYKNRLIFSLEDELDQIIVSDDFVYAKYQEMIIETFSICDDSLLSTTANKVLDELSKLSKDTINAKASLYLDKEPFTLEEARYDINKSIEYLKSRRALILKELDSN